MKGRHISFSHMIVLLALCSPYFLLAQKAQLEVIDTTLSVSVLKPELDVNSGVVGPVHHNRALPVYRLESDVELDIESGPLSGSCSVSILKTDSLMITFQGPFGILLGKLSACSSSMLYFDALRTEAVEANPESESVKDRMPIPLNYNDIIHLMRCEVPYESAQYIMSKSQPDEASMIYSYSSDERFVDFVKLSKKDGALMTYQRKSRTGELLLNINYSNYITREGVLFPRSIVMNFPERKTVARFTVTDFVLNPVGEHYSFSIPKGVKRTKLD